MHPPLAKPEFISTFRGDARRSVRVG